MWAEFKGRTLTLITFRNENVTHPPQKYTNTNRETSLLEVIPDKVFNFVVLREYYTVIK